MTNHKQWIVGQQLHSFSPANEIYINLAVSERSIRSADHEMQADYLQLQQLKCHQSTYDCRASTGRLHVNTTQHWVYCPRFINDWHLWLSDDLQLVLKKSSWNNNLNRDCHRWKWCSLFSCLTYLRAMTKFKPKFRAANIPEQSTQMIRPSSRYTHRQQWTVGELRDTSTYSICCTSYCK